MVIVDYSLVLLEVICVIVDDIDWLVKLLFEGLLGGGQIGVLGGENINGEGSMKFYYQVILVIIEE